MTDQSSDPGDVRSGDDKSTDKNKPHILSFKVGDAKSVEEEEQSPALPFKINPLFRDIFPKYSEAQMEELVKSIRKYGQLQDIFINKKDEILNGHNTHEVCRLLGIAPKYRVMNFNSIAWANVTSGC